MAMAALALTACGSEAAQEEAVSPAIEETVQTHPISGLEIIPVTLTTSTGTHVIQAELAATPDEQRDGLMFRQQLGPDEGMIFPKDPVQPLSFWMRNTVIPLDLIFIDENREVINIEQGEAYNETPIQSDRPGIAVLELAAGRSDELGLQPGDSVEW